MVEHLRLLSETTWLTFNEQLNNNAKKKLNNNAWRGSVT